MRERYTEVSADDVRGCIPEDTLALIRDEASRILPGMLQQISYSDDIRMTSPDQTRVSLGALVSDEEAKRLFVYLLEENPVSGILLGTKVKTGKKSETLMGSLKRRIHMRISAQILRGIGDRIREKASAGRNEERSGRRRRETEWRLGGLLVRPDDLGWGSVLAALADEVCRTTKILHACAARYGLQPVIGMLDLYDSIHDNYLAHVPDLFRGARKQKRHFVIHVGGTNTGKTHDAMAALARAASGVYLCPLRMLAYEGRAVIESYGVPCSFATGEEKEMRPGAGHVSETIGMLSFDRKYDMAVIDECQLISGEDGSLYTNAILGVRADVVQVCCAWSGLEITERLISLCGDDYEVVEHRRASELLFEEEPYIGPRKHDAYIVFSRLGAYEMAGWLEKQGMHPSIVYGKLPYEVKMEEAAKFERGDTDCLVATDAIAIGQNYSIERIVFRDVVKHINRREVELDSQTVKQVAGRAGRYGRFPVGYVNTFYEEDREGIRKKLEEKDVPARKAPLELPAFLVEKDLPLSLIYKAWNEAECGEPFVKADTTVELYICRLIETKYPDIGKQDEYSLASLPLDLKDREQEALLDNLLYIYGRGHASDEEWKLLLPQPDEIRRLVRYRPHMMTLEKLLRQLDLASSFFYKIRRDDLASYAIRLKGPLTKRITELMSEKPDREDVSAGGEKTDGGAPSGGEEPNGGMPADTEKPVRDVSAGDVKPDTSDWPTAYIYVTVSGQTQRNTGRFPYGDYRKLFSRELRQSYGNEASYIDYFCYKRKNRIPDECLYEPYFRYTVKLDPRYIVSDEGAYYLAERFRTVRCDYRNSGRGL